MTKNPKSLPPWITICLTLSMLIIFWDVTFLLFRPLFLPGHHIPTIWLPYTTYIKVDTSYADMTDDFVIAQAIMSLCEIGIGIIALYFNYLRKTSAATVFAFSAFLLTGTKTILVFLLEAVSGLKHVGHNPMSDLILYYVLPNSLWIIIPFVAVFSLGRSLLSPNR